MTDPLQTSSSEETPPDWIPCPDGKVSGLVGKLKHQRRMQTIRNTAAVSVCLLALVMLGRTLLTSDEPALTRLNHDQVVQLSQDYIEGKLDEQTTRLVEAHIELCPQCAHLREDRKAYLKKQAWLDPEGGSKLVAHSR